MARVVEEPRRRYRVASDFGYKKLFTKRLEGYRTATLDRARLQPRRRSPVQMKPRSFLSLSLLLALLATAPAGQQGPPTAVFQVEIDYVDVDVSVTDAQGNFVRDLTRTDFEVFEDGKPQKVDLFSLVEIPREPRAGFSFAGRPIASDVRSNRSASEGRFYVLVL